MLLLDVNVVLRYDPILLQFLVSRAFQPQWRIDAVQIESLVVLHYWYSTVVFFCTRHFMSSFTVNDVLLNNL